MYLAGILLAAGEGKRFGSNKLLASFQGGRLVDPALRLLADGPFSERVVVAAHPEVALAAQALGLKVAENREGGRGQSLSVRLGLKALEGQADGALFLLADMPWLSAGSLNRMAAAFRQQPEAVVCLSWRGERRNPVLFPRELFPELMGLEGDTGGREVLRRFPGKIVLTEAFSCRELKDVDFPEALE